MPTVFPQCAGLDVHQPFVTVCRVMVDVRGHRRQAVRTVGTLTYEIEAMAAWLADGGGTDVALASSGVYWQPIDTLLAGRVRIWLVNAQQIKHVPDRKTDVKDAEWLAQLLPYGILKPSCIPERAHRELRDLVRYRQTLVDERSRMTNRVQTVLEDANLILASVATDRHGASAHAILHALLAGERDPVQLADLARGRLRQKRAALEPALVGRLRPHQCFVLAHVLTQLDVLDEEMTAIEAQFEVQIDQLPGVRDAIVWLATIPGVSLHTVILIIAEVGVDLSRCANDRQLTAWAGFVPGNNQTGGKQRPTRTRWGNRYLRRGLIQAARAAARTKNTYLRALSYRLAARRGKHRAAVVVARTIVQIAYHLMPRGAVDGELGPDYVDRLEREQTTKRLVKRPAALGDEVNLTASGATPG